MKWISSSDSSRPVRKNFGLLKNGIFLGLCFGVFTLLALNAAKAQVPDFAITIEDRSSKAGKEKVKDPSYGDGTKELFEVTFKVKITNNKEGELGPVTLRLIPFFIQYDWNSKEEGHKPGKVQELKNQVLPNKEEKSFDFASEKFDIQQTFDKKTGTSWRSGNEYMGCVLELVQNGQVIASKVVGDSKVRRAYTTLNEKKTP